MPEAHQLLALDVGQKRLGVARAHSQARLPEPIAILANSQAGLVDLQTIIDRWQPAVIVIGRPSRLLPVWFTDWQLQFKERINFSGQVVYQDEFLTTQAARQSEPRRGHVDDRAACIILTDYLEQ